MHLRRVWLMWICCVVLAACATPAQSPIATATLPPPKAVTTLVVWHAFGGSEAFVYEDILQSIAAANGYTIVSQRMPASTLLADITTAWQSAKGPHVVIVNNTHAIALAQRGLALKLDALVAGPRRDALSQPVRDTTRYTDATGATGWYGVPVTSAFPVLFYNTRAVLQAPQTSDDMLVMARALHNAPDWGLGADITFDTFGGYLAGFGGAVFDADNRVVLGTSGRDGAERWLAWLATLNADPDLLTRLHGVFDVERTVGAGQLAMVIDSSARRSTYQQVWGDALAVAPLPRYAESDTDVAPVLSSTAVVLNQRLTADEVRAAQSLIDALLSSEYQATFAQNGIQPVNRTVDTSTMPAVASIQRAAVGAVAPSPFMLRYDVQRVMQSAIRQVLAGVVTPTEAITTADSQLRAIVEGTDIP
jgi:ABC-type glycerol-3-phosphate transport system substrate-binding protein